MVFCFVALYQNQQNIEAITRRTAFRRTPQSVNFSECSVVLRFSFYGLDFH